MYSNCYVFLVIFMYCYCSVYSVSLCCSVLFCVLYCCHRVSTQMLLTNIYRIISKFYKANRVLEETVERDSIGDKLVELRNRCEDNINMNLKKVI
jgi:hypothetical protein